MNNKLKYILCCSLLIIAEKVQAQCPKFIYSYDNAGNRTQRIYTAVCSNIRKAKDTTFIDSLFAIAEQEQIKLPETSTEITDNETDEYGFRLAELKNVYPNPTRGNFVVQFSTYVKNGKLELWDMKGTLLHTQQLYGSEFQIDISLLPASTYILNILLPEGKAYNKKIVKI
jgi:hypothetical protein